MKSKQLQKYLSEASNPSEVLFIIDDKIYEIASICFVAGFKETGESEFHIHLHKVDEIVGLTEKGNGDEQVSTV